MHPAKDDGCTDKEQSARHGILPPDDARGIVKLFERSPAFLEERSALGRQGDVPRGPSQERDSKLLLERGDSAAHGRRGYTHGASGSTEATPLGDFDQSPQTLKPIHDYCMLRNNEVQFTIIIAETCEPYMPCSTKEHER